MSTRPQPASHKTIEFLKQWSKTGPWVMTSIQLDRKGIDTATFYPKDAKDCLAWIEKWNGKRNIYFHVNSVTHDLTKKAERTDIKSVDYLHVDVDPREGKDIVAERESILDKFYDNRPKGIPEPTCIIFSGGGFQAFWKLEESIRVDGDLGLAEEAKRFNQQLEIVFGVDNCHNIDRIMRAPGTLNIPDARKIKKGRQVELATVLEFNDNEYDIKEFTPAPESKSKTTGEGRVSISTNVKRIESVDELDKWKVPERIKIIIAQGHHPEQPKKGDNTRSVWVFDVCCTLVRCGVPDGVIYSIITDPEFGISESVLEKGRG